jgi:hypothetical protein
MTDEKQVEAKRLADRIHKRESRAAAKQNRDREKDEQARRLAAEEASAKLTGLNQSAPKISSTNFDQIRITVRKRTSNSKR